MSLLDLAGTAVVPQSRRRTWELSSATIYGAWAIMTLVAILPFFIFAIPIGYDTHFHMARMRVLVDLDHRYFSDWFVSSWGFIPNLAEDLIVPFLAHVFPVNFASKLFEALILVLTSGGVLYMHRGLHRKVSPWPLVIGLFLYHWILYFGFMNYLFGIALLPWALGTYVRVRRKPWWQQIPVMLAFCMGLFFCHLYSLGLLGLLIGGYEVNRLWTRGATTEEVCKHLLIGWAPFLVPFLLFVLDSSMTEHAHETTWWWSWKLKAIWGFLMTGNLFSDLLLMIGCAVLLGIAIWRRWLVLHENSKINFVIILALYPLMPVLLFGALHADTRFPIAATVLLIALFDIRRRDEKLQTIAAMAIVGLFVVRMAGVYYDWGRAQTEYGERLAAYSVMKPGSVMFSAGYDYKFQYPWESPSYWNPNVGHAASLATAYYDVLVPEMYLVEGHEPVIYRKAFDPLESLQVLTEDAGRLHTPRALHTDADLVKYVDQIKAAVTETKYPFSGVYLVVDDPDRKLHAPAGTMVVAEKRRFYLLELDDALPKTASR